MKKTFRSAAPIAFLALPAFLMLACSMDLGGPTPPGPAITPQGNPDQMEQTWKNAIVDATNGTVVVIFTEAQVTAYVQDQLNANPDNTFHDAQVFLRDGRIKVYGAYVTSSVSATAVITLRPQLEAGQVNIIVEDAQVGPLDLPTSILSGISDTLNEAFTGQVGTLTIGFQVKEILIGDGQIAIRGAVH